VYWIWSAFALKRVNGSPQGFALRDDGTAFVATLKGISSALDMESLCVEKGQWIATGLRDDGMAFVATLKGISSVLDMESLPLKRANGSPQGFALRDDGAVFVRGP